MVDNLNEIKCDIGAAVTDRRLSFDLIASIGLHAIAPSSSWLH